MDKAQAMKLMAESHRETVRELRNELIKYQEVCFEQANKIFGLEQQRKHYRDGIKKLKNYLEGTIPMIPYNEKPLILTESLKIINEILEDES